MSAPREPLLHVLQQSCCLCSREAAAPHAPVEPLYLLPDSHCSTRFSVAALCALGSSCSLCSSGAAVFAPSEQLLHVLQQSCSVFSREAAAQSWSCTCSLNDICCICVPSRAAVCAHTLHNAPPELLCAPGRAEGRSRSVCSSGTALCVPRISCSIIHMLGFLFYREPFCHPQ